MSRIIIMMMLAVVAASCENIKNFRIFADPDSKMLVATCDGTRINWDYCYEVAAKLCPGGYEISDRQEIPNKPEVANRTQITRKIYFKCK